MSKFFLSTAALFSLLVTAFLIPVRVEARSRRCGEEPPETLLSLYKNSSEIHIGIFDRIEDVGMIEDTEDYSVIDMRKHFSISSTLKGEPRKFYAATEQDYRYKSVEPEAVEDAEGSPEPDGTAGSEEMIESDDDTYLADIAKPGDRVMIFLRKDAETGSLIFTHYRDAVKKLDAEKMSAYETRVSELNSIFAAKKVDDAEIVKWLVKTAVDPMTRWEGAFELLSGFQNAEWRDERAEYLKGKESRGESIEEWERFDSESDEDHNVRARLAYVQLLSNSQKEDLLTAVVSSMRAEPEDGERQTANLDEGDRMLLELVSRWGDSRLAGHLIDQLRNNPDLPYWNAQMMQMAAKVLGDPRLDDLATKYSNLYGSDEEIVAEEDLTAVGYTDEPTNGSEHTDLEPETGTEQTETKPAEIEGRILKLTYAEMRTGLLNKFILLGDELLTTEAK
jgi:hypothetical protein